MLATILAMSADGALPDSIVYIPEGTHTLTPTVIGKLC